MDGCPIGVKIYLQPKEAIFDAITDLAELQGAQTTLSDSGLGDICFIVVLYGLKCEYRFSITNLERKRCAVRLEIGGLERDEPGGETMIRRQFALLDSMLVIYADMVFDV